MTITRIGPLSCAKLAGLLYGALGLVFGAFVSAAAIVGSFASSDSAFPMSLFGAGAIVFLPLCYGVLGFVSTLIMAWLYNVAASVVGGVEIQTQ